MKGRAGNFTGNADEFDNKFFKILPREARSMDPQLEVLIHSAYETLEDGSNFPNSTTSFNADTFACYVGVVSR